MNNSKTFDALKSEMKKKRITQREVSNHLNAGNSYLWKSIKRGTVRIETLESICEFLDLELYLVNPEEEIEIKLM